MFIVKVVQVQFEQDTFSILGKSWTEKKNKQKKTTEGCYNALT